MAQAPAGIQTAINAVALEAYFTPTDLNTMESIHCNPIKLIPNSGYCIFGAHTLGSIYPNTFVNIARTLTQFVVDFQAITQYAIFQNNDSVLWASITNTLTNYLNQAMQMGMLASNNSASAYVVTCDSSVNTPTTAQAGIVNVQVQVALVSPAEFIVINLSQTSSGSSATISQ